MWFSVLGNPISSDLKTRRNLWKWDRDGNAPKIITRVAFQFHAIMSRRPVASLVYYILHNKESGWRYSRRISRDHQLRGRKLRGTRIEGLKLPERGPIQRKPNVKSSFQINTWSDLWAIILPVEEQQQQFKSPSQKRGEQMMGRDGGRLGSTWNAIETPSWGCWVSDIITVRKGLNAAALGGGWSIRGTWPWRWWKH